VFNALADFLIYCRVERRLSELTCRAYERDVRAAGDRWISGSRRI
jgi:site-specific recombinase XerD